MTQVISNALRGPLTRHDFNYLYHLSIAKDIRHHINTIMNDANKLREMGSPLQDKYIINRMLQTLPETFRHVRSAWTNVPTNEKTIENLTQRLIAEEGVVASYAIQGPSTSNTTTLAFKAKNTG